MVEYYIKDRTCESPGRPDYFGVRVSECLVWESIGFDNPPTESAVDSGWFHPGAARLNGVFQRWVGRVGNCLP